jgi:hypothetical protein
VERTRLLADAPTENRHQYKTLTHSVRGFGCIRFMDTMSGVPSTPGFVATISKTNFQAASAKPLPNARQKRPEIMLHKFYPQMGIGAGKPRA